MLLDVELPGVAELARCWYSKRLRAADSDPAHGKGGVEATMGFISS